MNTSATPSRFTFPQPSALDWRGWSVVLTSGIGAGIAIGSGSSGLLHWDRLAGPITAGLAVGSLIGFLASRRVIAKTLIACCLVVGSCLATITLRHWSTRHWPMWHIDGKWPFIAISLIAYVCVPATLVSLVILAVRKKIAEPGRWRQSA